MNSVVIIKDNTTYDLFKKRDKMYNTLIETYKIKRKYFNNIIKLYNIKRKYSINAAAECKISTQGRNFESKFECIDLHKVYEIQVKLFREYILTANMEFIHFQSMIDKVTEIRDLNKEQINKYDIEREYQILLKNHELTGDWSNDEKQIMNNHHIIMSNLKKKCGNMLYDIYFRDNSNEEIDLNKKIKEMDTQTENNFLIVKKIQDEIDKLCTQNKFIGEEINISQKAHLDATRCKN